MSELCNAILYKLSESLTLVSNAIQEVDDNKVNRTGSVSSTIPTTGWVSDSTYSDYSFRYDFSAAEVTANDLVVMTISPASLKTALSCGLCPTNQSEEGTIKVWAKSVPTSTIAIEYKIGEGPTE